MSFHREAMQLGREQLGDTAGIVVTYDEPDNAEFESVAMLVRHTSAEEEPVETDRGPTMERVVYVNVTGQDAATVKIGGTFLLDVDGAGEAVWTITSFAHSAAAGMTGGFRRCRCKQVKQLRGAVGAPRRDR